MGPLHGIRVVDLSQVISGPLAAAWLSDQGADVVKIEDKRGDPSRAIGTKKGDISALFFAVNRGKRSVVLDLKSADGCAALTELLENADVMIQNFRPGVIERLGFGYEKLAARFPRLVYCSISGYGPKGPRAGARVYDSVMQAVAGIAATQGPAGGAPEFVRNYICDKTTSLVTAQAITAALFARERTGRGQHVEINMFDTSVAYLWPEGMQNHVFLDDPPAATAEVADFYKLWPTRDGQVALAAPKEEEFRALWRALGRPEVCDDPRFATMSDRNIHRAAYQAILAEVVAQWESHELDQRLQAEDAAGGRVSTRLQLLEEPQAAFNGTIVEVDGGAEVGRIRAALHPARFSDTPTAPPRAAPHLGQHTADVLAGLNARAGSA